MDQFVNQAIGQGQVSKYTATGNTWKDGGYLGQCVSLINQYCWRVLGVPAAAWGNAKDWGTTDASGNLTNANVRQYFDRVGSPQRGDIGVLGSNYGGGVGHIFIYLSPTTIIEQNGRSPLRITTGSAYANPIAILRRKGTPAQGGSVGATKVTRETLRMIHSEMEGWPLVRTHNGEFDSQFWASWGGQDLEAVMWEKWNKNAPWRNRRQAALDFYDQYQASIGELKGRPSQEEWNKIKSEMEEANRKMAEATALADQRAKDLAEEQAKRTEDTKTLDQGASALQSFWAFIQSLLNRGKK